MNLHERTRRTALVCCHCLRNIAFYRAGWRQGEIRVLEQFWIGANGAFLDVAVLEWCKVFGEWGGKHHWHRVILDRGGFESELFQDLRMSKGQFEDYVKSIRTYRDKFVAHLDHEPVMHIPRMRVARRSAAFLFNFLQNDPRLRTFLVADAPGSAKALYDLTYRLACAEYKRRTAP